jgi:HD-GYP domain-containing protein (c-di-GMP phosphodiesterase class II)
VVGDDDDAPWDKGFGSARPDPYRTQGGTKRPTGLTNPGAGSPYATNPGRSVDVGQTNPGASVELSLDIGRKSTPGRARPTGRTDTLARTTPGRPDPRRTSGDLGATQPGRFPDDALGATQPGGFAGGNLSATQTGSFLGGEPGSTLGGPPPGALQEDERKRRQHLARKAKEFLVHIDTLGRLLMIHDARNSAVQAALRELVADVVALQQGGEDLKLVFAEGHAFVNGVWVRASKRAWEAAQLLTERLEGVEGRGLVLEPGTEAATLLALTEFLRTPPPEGVSGAQHFKNAALPGIRLVPLPSQADRARAGQPQALDQAVEVFKEGLETVTRAELANLDLYMRRRQRALVQNLIQLAENSPEELLTLTVMRDPTLGSRAHTLMVAIYAIALGRLMDLTRRDLLRLGMCALNHNVGESLLDEGLFAADRKLQSHERMTIEQHPLLGMLHVLKHYGFGAASLERALTAAEHHMHHDAQGGYPFQTDRSTHLFSRIIAVADVFDALCSQRPWRDGYPPDQAVKLVTRQGGRHLDPIVVRRLLWLVGRYPPGSMVELDTGEWALVVGPGRGAYPLVRPRILLISDEDGWELPTPVVVDLGERHPRRRAWLRTIARTRDPRKLGLEVAPYFFGDRIEADPGRLDVDEMGDQ